MRETKRVQSSNDNSYSSKYFQSIFSTKIKKNSSGVLFITAFLLLFSNFTIGQSNPDASNARFTQGEVNESATVSLGVPLGSYQGRGLNLPISLSYSSSVWQIEHINTVKNYNHPNYHSPQFVTQSVTEAIYAKYSKAGWKSSLDLPVIEFPKATDIYTNLGKSTTSNVVDCYHGYRIAKVFIHMPDGSSHELRKSDVPHKLGYVDMSGTFYAIDGSRMRFDATGADTGTLYMPDGTRYVLGHPYSYIIDRNSNTLTYNESNRRWTDTLGRNIYNPIPADPEAGQEYTYTLPGLNGVSPDGVLTYKSKWEYLADALTPDENNNTPDLRYAASHYLSSPTAPPDNGSNFPQEQPTDVDNLFHSESVLNVASQDYSLVPTIVVGRGQGREALFNPVVLKEITLPNGTKYKFSYNVYGEIDKVVFPTNAYETYQIESPEAVGGDELESKQPYVQTERRIKSRKLSIDGTGGDIKEWKYSESYGSTSGILDTGGKTRITKIIAPDNTRTEITNLYINGVGFGYSSPLSGSTIQRKTYSTSTDGTQGNLLRREITDYAMTWGLYQQTIEQGCTAVSYTTARHPRPVKSVSVLIEGSGAALAQTQTYGYDLTYETTTGVDQNLSSTYHYAVVENTTSSSTAQSGTIGSIPLGSLANYSETTYLNTSTYQNKNILGLPTKARVKDNLGNIVSQSEIVYDETNYSPEVGRALPTSSRTWDSTKGIVSNINAYLTTRAKFDTYGNSLEATDAKGNIAVTEYDPTYHAFPIKVTTPVPDPNPSGNPDGLAHSSSTTFVSTATYDTMTPPLGLVMATIDPDGGTTTTEYDAYLRPKKITPPSAGGIMETIYNDTPGDIWVKSRTQIDQTKWAESVIYYDGVGRAVKSKKIDSPSNVMVQTEFDMMGRAKRTTNPYRVDSGDSATETVVWTVNDFDDLGRVVKTTSPDGAFSQSSYGLSMTTGFVGTTKQITDQTGKKRKGITDGLGKMIRVIEDPDGQNLSTDYKFDTLGNLHETIQGAQHRYFMYDSLGRLLRAKQPEQSVNSALALATADPITSHNQWSVGYSYDDNGNIILMTDARNLSITGHYDKFDRLIYRDYSDPNTPDVGFFYDGKGLSAVPNNSKGKRTKISSSVSETRYTSFDNLGRLLNSQQLTTAAQRSGAQDAYASTYTYNLSGGLMTETYPSTRVVTNTLNSDGELEKVESKKISTATSKVYLSNIKYTKFGAVEQARLGNGRWENTEYDTNRLQVKQIALGSSDTDKSLLKIDYNYGAATENNGSLREQKITYAGQTSQIVQTYAYDSLNRLQSATEKFNSGQQAWKQTFDYDRYGNREFDAANTTTLGSCPQNQCDPEINLSDNRFADGQGYSYDATGNVTQDATNQRFTYDSENRQIQFFTGTNSTQSPDATYQYDGEGKRVRKISGQTETIFVYNGSGTLIAEYSTQISTTPQVSYLTSDALSSPRIITDGAGAVISRHDYRGFGDEITANIGGRTTAHKYGAADGVRKQYTNYERDTESGLDFAQARYYNSAHGRFTSVDPLTASATIKNPQTFNRYSYVTNNPYKFVDPLGLFGISPGGGQCGCSVNPLGNYNAKRSSGSRTASAHASPSQSVAVGEHSADQGIATPAKPSPQPSVASLHGGDPIIVNLGWGIKNDNGTADVPKETKDIINAATGRMATNNYEAMIAVQALKNYPKTSVKVKFEVSVSGGLSKGKLALGGGEATLGAEIEYTSTDSIMKDLQLANDKIRGELVDTLMNAEMWIPGEYLPTSKQGKDISSGKAPNMPAHFGRLATEAALTAATDKYNLIYYERKGPPIEFSMGNFRKVPE